MEIDIRKKGTDTVDRIRFDTAEEPDDAYFADTIWRYSGDCNVWVSINQVTNLQSWGLGTRLLQKT